MMSKNLVPRSHRLHLIDGRVVTGSIHRSSQTRLVQHLTSLQRFVSLTNVEVDGETHRPEHLVVNIDHIVSIEEIERVED